MEDGSDGLSSATVQPSSLRNGEVMANFPDVDISVDNETKRVASPVKVNGDSTVEQNKSEDEFDSSDCDALVIDESAKPQKLRKLKSSKPKCGGFKGFKKSDISDNFVHSNPYFSESIFDLLEKSQEKKQEELTTSESVVCGKKSNCKNHTKPSVERKTKANPKLREYAQYLGLQPTVQFKCSKCMRAGFPSLASLNEHVVQCNDSVPVTDSSTVCLSSAPTTNIRVTRKVFLCSACGTYYENWNLFLHMREVHKRYICLYCLGMFSYAESLAVHIVSKHNCIPNHIGTLEEFYSLHGEPCFLMCCECQKGFTERDNFFEHMCTDNNKISFGKNLGQKQVSRQINKSLKSKPVEHVTADSSNATDCITAENIADVAEIVPTDIPVVDKVCAEDSSMNSGDNVGVTSDDTVKHKAEDIGEVDMNNKPSNDQDGVCLPESDRSQIDNGEGIVAKETDDQFVENTGSESITVETQHKSEGCEKPLSDIDVKEPELDFTQTESSDQQHLQDVENGDVEKDSEDVVEEENSVSSDQENSNLSDGFDMNATDEHEEENENETAEESELNPEAGSSKENEIVKQVEDEIRKVPKVTLKLPKAYEYNMQDEGEPVYESDDSEKLTMEVDQIENEAETKFVEELPLANYDMHIAGSDVPITELELEQPLDKFDIRALVQKCLRTTVPTCVYCNHARRISVNGKQLGLHAIAEHRYSAIVNSITAEELIPESFVARIQDGLPELEDIFFNLESSSPEEAVTFSHIFECFQCRYSTTIHKELYLHNRKMHAKSILLCIMCKSNFYSYSELICHLCPGLYELDNEVHFRCCMCVNDELPSAFRLMVHLRKRHHACDVCLELCHNQSRLSNHVWKHKLHHLCYRCGIAYRNKPDITKHLFWKHGTESVLCKKCLQKKWPHVYHFCIPPTNFSCEECNLTFTRAVSLMVHKRLHTNEKSHACSEETCTERFISKKLLLKHEFKHREPPEEAARTDSDRGQENEGADVPPVTDHTEEENLIKDATEADDKSDKVKPKVDVYDLPELNLSESDSSDSDADVQKNLGVTRSEIDVSEREKDSERQTEIKQTTDLQKPAPVLETIWDDFRNYQANKEKLHGHSTETDGKEPVPESTQFVPSLEIILKDHDYCIVSSSDKKEEYGNRENIDMSVDHDYCFGATSASDDKQADKSQKKKADGSSSGTSSDSDSSSCTCGSNCSCSSSSGSSSSSSDSSESDSSTSAGRRRQQLRRDRRKQKTKKKRNETENVAVDVVATDNQPMLLEAPIQESDLETTESDTDEDFYDKQPQKLANKLLAEKKNQLLQVAAIGPYINGSIMDGSRPATPTLPDEARPKRKSKSKKRKKKSKSSKYESENPNANIPQSYPIVSPLTLTLPKHSPVTTPLYNSPNSNITLPNLPTISRSMSSLSESDPNLRASKRRRVPNRFYGYSSDEDQDKIPQPPVFKWRKIDLPTPKSPLVVPPITIKTVQPLAPTVDPISIRSTATPGELRVQQARPVQPMHPSAASSKVRSLPVQEPESGSDSNDTSSEDERPPIKEQPALYCYCRCPYDEVSEMIGCDASDCAIEWFHFECVGIMVPPKGQWFCPDCRKKKQQRREMLQSQL